MTKRTGLLIFNLCTDVDHPVLGFTTYWIRAISEYYENVYVITMCKGRLDLPGNVKVYSLGKEQGYSEVRRLFRFYKLLAKLLFSEKIDHCFAHMNPLFVVLGGVILRLKGIPIITWYAHRQKNLILKIAYYLSHYIVSANAASYTYKKKRFVALGHGIDVNVYRQTSKRIMKKLILTVGRISPIKNPLLLLDAMEKLWHKGNPLKIVFVGDVLAVHVKYAKTVYAKVEGKKYGDKVTFAGAAKINETVEWYNKGFIHVNCSPKNHSIDKAVLEPMLCGILSLTSAESCRETMGEYQDVLIFKENDEYDLANKIEYLFDRSEKELEDMTTYLKQRVAAMHSLESLAGKLVNLFDSLDYKKQNR